MNLIKLTIILIMLTTSILDSFADDQMLLILKKCQDSESMTKKYLQNLQQKNNITAKEQSYKAALLSLMAKHAFNPFTKLNYLDQSNVNYQEAVDLNPNDIEIRLLRFNTQTNMPSIFQKKEILNEDKNILINYLSKKGNNKFLSEAILECFANSKDLTDLEKKMLIKN